MSNLPQELWWRVHAVCSIFESVRRSEIGEHLLCICTCRLETHHVVIEESVNQIIPYPGSV